MKNTDDPLCGCTIVDKDHEATVQVGQQGLTNYFEFLHRLVLFSIIGFKGSFSIQKFCRSLTY
jgi:hypothetical protein